MGLFDSVGKFLGLKSSKQKMPAYSSKRQKEVEKLLLNRAKGKGPSVAGEQVRRAQTDAAKKLMGVLTSGRSRSAGLARRQAGQAGAEVMKDIGSQYGLARAAEMQGAAGQLYAGMTGMAGQKLQADIQGEAQTQKGMSRLFNIGSSIASALSDEECKKDIDKNVNSEVKNFLNAIKGSTYKYKKDAPVKDGEKKHLGVMAQNLEKTKLGKSMVEEGPKGNKQINFGEGFNAMLASMASLNDRLSKIEDGDIKEFLKKKRKKGSK